jgi:Domain of unknown function (DUF4276)
VKVGFIFECGPQGADKKVCEHIVTRFFPHVEIGRSITLDNKPKLIQGCGKNSRLLLDEGCDLVVIMWDLFPAWRQDGERPNCVRDRNEIRRQLLAHGVDNGRVRLLCIREELEAWILADERALSSFLSRDTHPISCPRKRHPETVRNPKNTLHSLFREARHGKYSDLDHALPIVQKIDSLDRLQKLQSFARFEKLLTGTAPNCQRHLLPKP